MIGRCFIRWFQGCGRAFGLLSAIGVWLGGMPSAEAAATGPQIQSIERRGAELVIRATAPEGVVRLVLEGSRQSDFRGWLPRAIERIVPGQREVVFTIGESGPVEMFRVRADDTDPLPASFYSGRTNFAKAVATGSDAGGPVRRNDAFGVPMTDVAETAPRSVVESDIWVVEGNRLYFFNQSRGLQVLNIANPDAPSVEGTFALAGAGEQMYVLGGRQAILLANDACNAWGTDSESAVLIIDTGVAPFAELARLPVRGRIVESRLVGTALYVASDSWQPRPDGSGNWEAGTWLHAFDLSEPAKPVARGTLWFPGAGNVVTATDRFLFVSIIDYATSWPWRSDLLVIDISAPDGSMTAFARIPLAGHVADKFKIDLLGDVLRVVVEATETAQGTRWVTVLETYRLSDPRAAAPVAYAKLDRLELARGERLFATRFDGERAYVVTFLRVDPLWIIDLSDPSDVKIAGELQIPGWSTYLRPMGDRLLAMGIDNVNGWRVAVQLFDVANPAKPALLSKIPLGENSSWSEANQDEKAFGIFPEAGLLLVPLSSWSSIGGGEQGVQLIDFNRDGLKQRGFLASSALVPRRATFRGDRVLTVSGRELATADVADRDHPKLTSTLELAYPVDRVVVVGDYVLEFQSGSVRVRRSDGDGTPARTLALGDLPVLGAAMHGNRLHLLQGRAAEVIWEQVKETTEWLTHTNAGTMVATAWDVASLPDLVSVGKASLAVTATWLPELRAHWPRSDALVWTTEDSGRGFWPFAVDAGLDIAVRPGGAWGGWFPWWLPSERRLISIGLGTDGAPTGMTSTVLEGEGQPAGSVVSGGSLLFSTRQIGHSEVVSTNVVIEQAWFARDPISVTNGVKQADGTIKYEVRQEYPGEYRKVTNSYPVSRWWSTFELDAVDFASGASSPIRRPVLPIGGQLVGASHQGALLYVTATREVEDGKGMQQAWLEASAYDGVTSQLVAAFVVADYGASETFAVSTRGADVFVARGGWEAKAVNRVERWRVADDAKWIKAGSAGLSSAPGELRVVGDLLAARGGSGGMEAFQIGMPGQLAPLPVISLPGCYGGDLTRADGDLASGLWLPFGEYGSIRVAGGAGNP